MLNPSSLTEFETAFQDLQFRLTLNMSERLKTRFLGEFCHSLQHRENLVLNHSYYQELLPALLQYLSIDSLVYQPIELLQAFYGTLRYTHERTEFDTEHADFERCFKIVKIQLVALFIYMGEYTNSIFLACEDESVDMDIVKFAEVTCIEEICIEAERQKFPKNILEIFLGIRDTLTTEISGYSRHKVWIPLVEKLVDSPGEEMIVGMMYPLELDIEPRQNNQSTDVISFNNHPLDQDDLVNYQAQDAMRAARNEHPFLKKRLTRRFTVIFGFPSSTYSYAGSSFGFGMSLLALCTLERESNLRKQSFISKSVAITGGIDLSGHIRTVNANGLKEKIRAAFYSPLLAMVIPPENVLQGQKILDELLEKHPLKKFTLIAEDTLHEILENRRVLRYNNIPFIEWTRNYLTRSKILQIIMIMVLAASLTIGGLSMIKDRNPSGYKVEGQHVLLFNHSGKYLWNIDLGHSPDYLENIEYKKPIYRHLQIHDYDGDGENEVILGTSIKQHEFSGRLYYIETDGSVKWMFSDHPVLKFGDSEYTDNYGVSFIYPFRHSDSKTYDIYVKFSHRPWFPNRLVRFDIQGNVLDEFIHPGSINDMEFLDLDQDGEMEIVLGTTNNGFNDAAVAILPSRGFGGTTPLWMSDRSLQGYEVDSNLVYIKFPHWGVYDITGTNARSSVDDIFLNSDGEFIVSVVLGNAGSYLYSFDLDLNLLGLSITDGFLSQYHKKYGQGFFEKFDRAEWYQKMTQLDVWRDGQWITRSCSN